MLYNFESETELEIARNWCAGAFGWSRKRLLGEAMAAPFSCRETCFVFASANAWRYPEGEALFLNVPWHRRIGRVQIYFEKWIYLKLFDVHWAHSIPRRHTSTTSSRAIRFQSSRCSWLTSYVNLSGDKKLKGICSNPQLCLKSRELHHSPELCSRNRRRKRVAFGRTEYATHVASCSALYRGRDRGINMINDSRATIRLTRCLWHHALIRSWRTILKIVPRSGCSFAALGRSKILGVISSVKWWAWNKLKSVQYVEMHSARLWKSRGRRLNPWSPS